MCSDLHREMRGNSWLYGNLTLFIPKVLPEFFGIPFECIIINPIGKDIGQVWLRQGNDLKMRMHCVQYNKLE